MALVRNIPLYKIYNSLIPKKKHTRQTFFIPKILKACFFYGAVGVCKRGSKLLPSALPTMFQLRFHHVSQNNESRVDGFLVKVTRQRPIQ